MRLDRQTAAGFFMVLVLLLAPGCSRAPNQTMFDSPDDAARALLWAVKAQDMESLGAIFGKAALEAVASGDSVSDRNDREVIALAMEQGWRWAPHRENSKELIIGDEQWPFPVPLVKTGNQWRFDSEAGKEEVLARRIGRNELGMIDLCHTYVSAQKEYAAEPRDGKPAGQYAQRIRSTPGHQDGLYWAAEPGARPSPLGDLAAEATIEGYAADRTSAKPFWGYHFRILTGQGPAAPGQKRSYLVNGEMKGGFALLAYPAKYGSSGVMTFIVNQDGTVYEKDLGADTLRIGSTLAEYNPDETWAAVQAP